MGAYAPVVDCGEAASPIMFGVGPNKYTSVSTQGGNATLNLGAGLGFPVQFGVRLWAVRLPFQVKKDSTSTPLVIDDWAF